VAWGSTVTSPNEVWGGTPAKKAFLSYLQPRKRTRWQQLWLFSSAETFQFEAKNCHPHHCLANSRTFQDLASRSPGLSSTKVIFQDCPGPGNFPIKIPGFSRRHGTMLFTHHLAPQSLWWYCTPIIWCTFLCLRPLQEGSCYSCKATHLWLSGYTWCQLWDMSESVNECCMTDQLCTLIAVSWPCTRLLPP